MTKGDTVRLDVLEEDGKKKLLAKSGKFKASHEPSFGETLYTVKRQRANNTVELEERAGQFPRGTVLLVQST